MPFLGVLVPPVYLAKRPLRSGETRDGGAAWNVLRKFALFWTIVMAALTIGGFIRAALTSPTPSSDAALFGAALGTAVGLGFMGTVWFFPTVGAVVLGLLLKKSSVVERGPTGPLAERSPQSSFSMPSGGWLSTVALGLVVAFGIAAQLEARDSKIGNASNEAPVSTVVNEDDLDSRIKTTLYAAATAMEEFYGANGVSYLGATVAALREHGFKPDDGVTITILEAGKDRFRLEARATGSSKGWVLDSDTGKVTEAPPVVAAPGLTPEPTAQVHAATALGSSRSASDMMMFVLERSDVGFNEIVFSSKTENCAERVQEAARKFGDEFKKSNRKARLLESRCVNPGRYVFSMDPDGDNVNVMMAGVVAGRLTVTEFDSLKQCEQARKGAVFKAYCGKTPHKIVSE